MAPDRRVERTRAPTPLSAATQPGGPDNPLARALYLFQAARHVLPHPWHDGPSSIQTICLQQTVLNTHVQDLSTHACQSDQSNRSLGTTHTSTQWPVRCRPFVSNRLWFRTCDTPAARPPLVSGLRIHRRAMAELGSTGSKRGHRQAPTTAAPETALSSDPSPARSAPASPSRSSASRRGKIGLIRFRVASASMAVGSIPSRG
jgi:hypothetical protein